MADHYGVSLPTELLHKLVNLGGLKKTMHCEKCNKFTEHVSISFTDVKGSKDTNVSAILTGILDYIPTNHILLGNPYVCLTCGKYRYSGGLLSGWATKVTRWE